MELVTRKQQMIFDDIAEALDLVCVREQNAKLDGIEKTTFYRRVDYEFNRSLEVNSPVAAKRPVWEFENTDRHGKYNCFFGNMGTVDLRFDIHSELEGHIRLALAKRNQLEYLFATGGPLALRESDEVYNDLNREQINAFHLIYPCCVLGKVNFYDAEREDVLNLRKDVYWTLDENKPVYDFSCSFIIPYPDEKLKRWILSWNSPSVPKIASVNAIVERIEKIGGVNFIWY